MFFQVKSNDYGNNCDSGRLQLTGQAQIIRLMQALSAGTFRTAGSICPALCQIVKCIGLIKNISVRLSASPKGAPMYAWHNMKTAPANQRRI